MRNMAVLHSPAFSYPLPVLVRVLFNLLIFKGKTLYYNKYKEWYHDWPLAPDQAVWNVAPGKPLFISEFGGEALYGKHGDAEVKSSWSEDYQAQLYKDNLEMFKHIPNLRGTSPWILFDFRSPFRFHPHQGGEWNRKGLVSDQGQRKKAWYIMRDYYNQKKTEQ